jgi:hypothetical protein
MAKKATKKTSKPTEARAAGPAAPKGRVAWLDEATHTPLINDYAQQMTSFINAMADGVIEDHELREQEARVVALMQEIEPLLSDQLHPKITQLLCEVTVYDLMQMMQALQHQRMQTTFRG